jgi:hypothetical protein
VDVFPFLYNHFYIGKDAFLAEIVHLAVLCMPPFLHNPQAYSAKGRIREKSGFKREITLRFPGFFPISH